MALPRAAMAAGASTPCQKKWLGSKLMPRFGPAAWRSRSGWQKRLGFYFVAFVIYYLSVAGVASVQLESMLRYDLCVHALIVLGLLHYLREFRLPPLYVRAAAMTLAALACVAGLGLQGFYVWNFTRGNWIA